jgi:electron transfer flavoprotein alpha subunit
VPENTEKLGGLWVIIEQRHGKVVRVSLELLGEARALADKAPSDVTAFLIGEDVAEIAEELIWQGADRVIIAEHAICRYYRTEVYTDIICTQAMKDKPEIILFGATCMGRDLAPRVSARLKTGCTSDCTKLAIDSGHLVATKPFFGHDLMTDIVCPVNRPQIATIRPGVLELTNPDRSRKGEILSYNIRLREDDIKVKVAGIINERSKNLPLEQAEKVVAGGMGVGSKEGFEMLKELANLLGAELGATTLPVDEGWISEEFKIGQTGKTIRPKLYIGCGVSGAIQHSAGMIGSEVIVAINKDPDADIFKLADYGILGDINEVIPAIIKEIQRQKGLV